MAGKTYINPKQVKEVVLRYESKIYYKWYEAQPSYKLKVLFGLITVKIMPAEKEGWGYDRISHEDLLRELEDYKIDFTGIKPQLLRKASITFYFGYRHYTTVYFETNEEALQYAEDAGNKAECTITIKQ